MKNFGEKEAWAYNGPPKFFGYPYYIRNGKSYRFQIWPVYSEGLSEQNPIKNLGEKAACTGTAQFFGVPPITAGTGEATDFKFGQYTGWRRKTPGTFAYVMQQSSSRKERM